MLSCPKTNINGTKYATLARRHAFNATGIGLSSAIPAAANAHIVIAI